MMVDLTPALTMMAQGMTGIFAVLGIIALFVAGMKKLDNPKKK